MNSLQEAIVDGLEAARVERSARWRLESALHSAIRRIECHFRHGRLSLKGEAPSYYHKQLAQEAMRDLPGVTEIINHISVQRSDRPSR